MESIDLHNVRIFAATAGMAGTSERVQRRN
jgi:hypothetical protein